MFEKLLPPNNYTIERGHCQWKFDFVKNLTMARAKITRGSGPGARNDNYLSATEHMFDS
jgi:hypothetical protein